jgi:hypothetical protein
MARRSCSEVQSELYLALDRKYITTVKLDTAYTLAGETKRLINGLIAYLRKSHKTQSHAPEIHELPGQYRTGDPISEIKD